MDQQQTQQRQSRAMHVQQAQQTRQQVVVTDVDISFGNMVMLLVKLAFASIPAMIIIWMVFAVMGVFMMTVFGVGGALFSGM